MFAGGGVGGDGGGGGCGGDGGGGGGGGLHESAHSLMVWLPLPLTHTGAEALDLSHPYVWSTVHVSLQFFVFFFFLEKKRKEEEKKKKRRRKEEDK